MTYKEFKKWCNENTYTGRWPLQYAIYCLSIYDDILDYPLWKRRKIYEEKYKDEVDKIKNEIDKYYKEI